MRPLTLVLTEPVRVIATRTAIILAVLVAWQLLPALGLVDSLTLVPFTDAVAKAVDLLASGEILHDLWATLSTILISFGTSAVGGVLVGFLLWQRRLAYRLLSPYLTTYYALPIFAFYPVLIAIFGLTVVPEIVIAAAWAIVAVILNTVTGLNEIPAVYHKTARVYRLSSAQAMRRVYLAAAAPMIANGLKLAASYCVIGVVAAEFVLSPNDGLGYRVSYYYNNFALSDMYATILLIVVLASLLTWTVGRLQVVLRGHR